MQFELLVYIINVNVPVVYMARYVMVLRRATSLRGALEGVGPEN
jgi:translation elongation factor EF-G